MKLNRASHWRSAEPTVVVTRETKPAKRQVRKARPTEIDREGFRASFNKRFAKTLAFLGR